MTAQVHGPDPYSSLRRVCPSWATTLGLHRPPSDIAPAAGEPRNELAIPKKEKEFLLIWWCGYVFDQLYHRNRRLEDLQRALENFQKLENSINDGRVPRMKLYRGGILESLTVIQLKRYGHLGELQDIHSAVKYAQSAVAVTLAAQPKHPRSLQILAAALTHRYERLSNADDIKTAVEYSMEALNLTSVDDRERCLSLQTVAWAHRGRYAVGGDSSDLDRAIQYYCQASSLALRLAHGEQSNLEYLRCIQRLSSSLGDRYQQNGDPTDLQKALKYDQTLFQHFPVSDPDQPRCLQNLAASLHDQYMATKELGDLQSAIRILEDAFEKMDVQNPHRPRCLQNLALYLTDRYNKSEDSSDLHKAFGCYSDSFENITLNPTESFKSALHWASLAQLHKPRDCLRAYSTAFRLLPETLWIGNSLHAHRAACREININQATSNAVNACVELSESDNDLSKLARAVEFVEQGLATSLQQRIQLKATCHTLLSQEDEDKLEALSCIIYSENTSSQQRQQAAMDRNDLLVEIRKKPGLQDFLLPKQYSEISQASENGPVVILNSHETRCDAIILLRPAHDPIQVALTDVTCKQLEIERENLQRLLRDPRGLKINWEAIPGTPAKDFDSLLQWLEKNIVTPVYTKLEEKGFREGTRLWWCPTGLFRGLPLHATDHSIRFIQSYTVTPAALLGSHPRRNPWSRRKLGIVGVTKTGPQGKNRLLHVKEEVEKVVSQLRHREKRVLVGKDATPTAVKSLLKKCSWVHLACHAEQNKSDPGNSCLNLYHGSLHLNTILHLQFRNPEFIFLAACETVKDDDTVINESLHLGGGFMATGFQGAIGTLWKMSDEDGPGLADAVYSRLFKNTQQPKVTEVAEALQSAVAELRSTQAPSQHWAPFIHIGV